MAVKDVRFSSFLFFVSLLSEQMRGGQQQLRNFSQVLALV